MLKKKEKVDFSELANVLMYSNQKVLVVYEEEVTRDHTFSEILDMQKQGAEFYLAEEDWDSLPVIGPEFDPYDGVTSGFNDAEKECGLPFTAPEEEKKECEADRLANTIIEAVNRANNPSPDPEPEEPEENGCMASVDALDAMVNGKQAEKSTVKKPIDKGRIKALYEAGWSIDRIADDMGKSFSTIHYHLKNMGLIGGK